MTSKEIRESFIDFFSEKQHKIEKYIPLLLKNDSTLMFVNSGMVQYKDIFLGNKNIENKRVVNFQKCLRVSGKHNDLEDVGKDTYHHTLFEMLGNWSFGDYFKKEAIEWAWEFLTKKCQISKENLYVTIFEGSNEDNIQMDNESYQIWKKLVPEERIIKGNKKDNFWEMGQQGPCGSCTEIHIDIRNEEEKKKIKGRDLINKDHPQVIEIWNLVFIEFNRKANGELEFLEKKHVDTGMGFERLVCILQKKQSNYDTDLFIPIIKEIENISKKKYDSDNQKINIAMRVVADHLKAVSFAISEGIIPSNNGEGYVIRRILRRAIRYGYSFLDIKEAFIYKLYDSLLGIYGDYYQELEIQKDFVKNIIKKEEQAFLRTLEDGLKKLDFMISKNKNIDGTKIFELYDTYGFPFDLTALILSENNISIDENGFKNEMEKQKNRSRKSSEVVSQDWIIVNNKNEIDFVGYDFREVKTNILRYRKIQQKDKELYQIVLEKTPFYPEGGGQIGDSGFLENSEKEQIKIIDTKKENSLIIHISEEIFSDLSREFIAKVDIKKRNNISSNHSATHLLHYTLRELFGKNIEQKGSFVSDKYLRFDFSHFEKISNENLKKVEARVNNLISESIELEEKRNTDYHKELENGVLALFGEKYTEKVRSIKFGSSYELCGGTHVKNTNEIIFFKIISESSVALGIRRIEAITSSNAIEFLLKKEEELESIRHEFRNSKNLFKDILILKQENEKYINFFEKIENEKIKSFKEELKGKIEKINDVNFVWSENSFNGKQIRELSFDLGNQIENLIFVSASKEEGKIIFSVYISKNLVKEKNLNANTFIKEVEDLIDGKGGGQSFFSVAGGNNPNNSQKAIEKIRLIILKL